MCTNENKLTPQTLAGTGGTISGIGNFLKSVQQDVRIVLADPEGSGLYNKVSLKSTFKSWGALYLFVSLLHQSPPIGHLSSGVFPSSTGKG